MPKKILSKEPKSRLRKHLELLFLLLVLSISILLLIIVLNYKDFIYPQLHRNQISPKEYVEKKVLNGVQNGSIVVFHIHDGSYAPKTHEAVAKIIPELKKRGFEFVTISEMLE